MTIPFNANAKMSDTTLSSESHTIMPFNPLPAVFSDDATRSSTPPSSPPGFPWEKEDEHVDVNKTSSPAMNAFSLLGKRKALDTISENARPTKKIATSGAKAADKDILKQMQMSLGQEVQKTCKTCGMEYVLSSAEDRKLHEKYHKQNTEGYDVGKDFLSKTRSHLLFPAPRKEDKVCAIDCFDSYARKRRGQTALDIVQRELGAVEIPKEDIWDPTRCEGLLAGDPTFRAYLYVRGTKCIGFLLVQKIKEAYRVVEPTLSTANQSLEPEKDGQKSTTGALAILKARREASAQQLQQPLQLSKETHPAQLGISRIWTSPTHRHQNIASTLLDIAFKDHNQSAKRNRTGTSDLRKKLEGHEVSHESVERLVPFTETMKGKDRVAFSQPTEAGVRLARRWFERNWGWHVYVD